MTSRSDKLRGRTRPGRLAHLDLYLQLREQPLLRAERGVLEGAPVLDIGLGERPDTTLELAACVRAIVPGRVVVGIDVDPDRVAAARALTDAVAWERFDVFAAADDRFRAYQGRARLARAMNLLRNLTPDGARAGQQRLGQLLSPGGLLLEGTCNRDGSVSACHVLRRAHDGRLLREALLLHTDFSRGCGPWLFRDQLPRDVRHSCRPGHPVHDLLRHFEAEFEACRNARDSRVRFARALSGLRARVPGVDGDPALLARGIFRWAPPGGVPDG